uniref:THAP4-like heme-binding domain-containing protein n=1 Tax=Eptatretus burgeri TaxID=7764 RepID=A0A8C4QHL1_EPTBU
MLRKNGTEKMHVDMKTRSMTSGCLERSVSWWFNLDVGNNINSSLNSLPLHPDVAHLEWLLGHWESKTLGQGTYPTIKSFHYHEQANFTHCGQPLLDYAFYAFHGDTGRPLHREVGFLRPRAGTDQIALIGAQNTGLSIVEEGEVRGKEITLTSHSVSRITFGKEPRVVKTKRILSLDQDGKLRQCFSMATSNQEMRPHLEITYCRKMP